MRNFQSLERRQLFAGGVDPSFGSDNGTAFDTPGDASFISDTAVDAVGRVVVAGREALESNSSLNKGIVLSRFNVDGELDSTFANGGSVTGTPRGVSGLSHVVASHDGGYVALGFTGGQVEGDTRAGRLLRFDSDGKIDHAFGRDGFVPVGDFLPSELLEQSDGKLLLVGSRIPDRSNPSIVLVSVTRLLANGSVDATYGINGFSDITRADDPVSIAYGTQIRSATFDSGGRLVVGLTGKKVILNRDDSIKGSATATYFRRLTRDGTNDSKFVGENVWSQSTDDPSDSFAVHSVVVITRPDGQVATLDRNEADNNISPTLSLIGAYGQLKTPGAPSVNLSSLVAGFAVHNLADGAMTVDADNRITIAGAQIIGSARTPMLVRLMPDLTLDTNFGSGGVLALPTAGGLVEASYIAINPDGTLTVRENGLRDSRIATADVTLARVFTDDRPVVALRSIARKGGQIRATVSLRGVNPVDSATIDSKDFKLVASDGGLAKARLLAVVDRANGDWEATYVFSRGRGTFSVNAIASQIEDDHDLSNAGRTIATITI